MPLNLGSIFGGGSTTGNGANGGIGGILSTVSGVAGAIPGIGGVVGTAVNIISGLFGGNKAHHWHAYEAPNTYITEISQSTFNTLKGLAPSAVVDSGQTYSNIKLPKQIADQLRAELAGTTSTIPLTPLNSTITDATISNNADGTPKKDDKIFGIEPMYLFGLGALLLILKKK